MSLKPILFIIILSTTLIRLALATNYNLPAEFSTLDISVNTSEPTILPPPTKKESIAASKIPTEPTPSTGKAIIKKPTLKLTLGSDSDSYRIGDSITFFIKSNKRCYLTVFNVGTTGKTTVLYPNAFKRNNYIEKNKKYLLPSDELMPVEAIIIGKPENSITDEETIIAICRTSTKPLFKEPYQFKRYNFREFPPTTNWKDQITSVDKYEEVRMEISFKAKPALSKK